MNLARVFANGQITVPAEVRKSLGLKPGDKILFTENDRGETVICNTSATALKRAQKAFRDRPMERRRVLTTSKHTYNVAIL